MSTVFDIWPVPYILSASLERALYCVKANSPIHFALGALYLGVFLQFINTPFHEPDQMSVVNSKEIEANANPFGPRM